ncbi:hypothetical protein A2335_02270 [Candidatus Peregrinibacteria bacterium RIFOXYB2_FULL_32_7]|nr:MAG: hypothetical protein A2335_02270 [Candidatus Peregrinibacteria bacterium RIFOXYB2_FULL_32_7]
MNKIQKPKKSLKHHAKQFISNSAALGFVFVGLLVVIFSVWWMSYVFSKPASFANYLPEDVAAFAQVNLQEIDLKNSLYLKNFLAEKGFGEEVLQNFVNSFFSASENTETADFLGSSFGVAVLDNVYSLQDKTVFFVELKSYKKFKEFLNQILATQNKKKLDEKIVNDRAFYVYPGAQSFYFYVLSDYAIFSADEMNLAQLLSSIDEKKTLKYQLGFETIAQNLMQFKPIFGYINVAKFFLNQDSNLDPKKNFQKNLIDMVDFIGFTASFDEGFVNSDSYLVFTSAFRDTLAKMPIRQKYKADLGYLLNGDEDFVFAGENLLLDFEIYKSAFDSLHPSISLILDGIAEAKKDKFFGEEILLADVLNLLSKEYQFAFKYNAAGFDFVSALDISSFDKDNVEKIIKAFISQNPFNKAKIEKVVLEDGTIMEKLVADFDDIEEITAQEYKGFAEKIYRLSDSRIEFALARNNEVLIIAGSSSLLKESIDRFLDGKKNFVADDLQFFADQVMFLSDDFLTKNFANFKFINEFINNAWIGEKLFEDGAYLKAKVDLKNGEALKKN